jgi:hypothetical protein
MSPLLVARTIAAGRAAIGAAMVVAPGRLAEAWVGSSSEPARILSRGLGARDVGLGIGTLVVLARGGDARAWVAAATLADATDALSSVAAGDRIPAAGRWGVTALAGGAALTGAWLLRAL